MRIDPALAAPASEAADSASRLRHDLITPVNHILGYCDLLIEDAEARGNVYRSRSVRSVRDLGRLALGAIDQTLARAVEQDRPVDVVAIGRALAVPCLAVVEACRAIEEVSARSPESAFLDDLARIKDSAVQLAETAARMAGTPQAGPRSTSSVNGSRTGRSDRADR